MPTCLLPDSVEPIEYKVHLALIPDFKFSGRMEMTLLVRKPTQSIVLHADELTDFRGVKLSSLDNGWTRDLVGAPRLDAEEQILTFDFGQIIPFGLAKLQFGFSGRINDKLGGLYQSTYRHPDGTKRYLATTQSEPIDARKIFPCFDEPGRKAIIELSVDIPGTLTAVSNMPVAKTETLPYGFKRVSFDPTPPISTYLFALIIGEFDESKWLTGRTKDGLLVRVITVPGKEHLGEHGLARAIRTLEFFTDYYNYGYPLPKYDLAAIPDFGAGAMENWGLEIFREEALLVDPRNTPHVQLERVDLVIDHESGHHWHGDLVTMSWWDDISLNEAFATWTELLVSRSLDPEKGAEEKFLVEDFVRALKADGLKTTRPVHVLIDHPDGIEEAFDAITYSKGGSVLRMLEHIAPEKFKDAMRRYIPRHEYGVVTQKDLWRAVGEMYGTDVVRMMDAWWNKPGYPVVSVRRGAPSGKYVISQSRFLYEGGDAAFEDLWEIPMRIRCGSHPGEIRSYVLAGKEAELDNLPQDSWIVWNAGATGFYRVHYDADSLPSIAKALLQGNINDRCERIVLFNDVAALTIAGYYDAKTLFSFYQGLARERQLRVWQGALGGVLDISSLFARESYAPQLDQFVRRVVEEAALELGWEERPKDSYQMKILRGLLLAALGTHGHEPTVDEAKTRFSLALSDLETLNPDLRAAVYRIVGSAGGEKEYEELLALYHKVDAQEEKNRIYNGLAAFREPELVKRTLDFLLTGDVRDQDKYIYLRPLGANPHAGKATWQFTKERWGRFGEIYGTKQLGRIIPAVASNLSSPEDEADVRAFFEAHPLPEAKRTIAQTLESIRINSALYLRERDSLAEYFSVPVLS